MHRNLSAGVTFAALIGGLAAGSHVLGKRAVVEAAGVQAPPL